MQLRLKGFSYFYIHGRNVLACTAVDDATGQCVITDQLSAILAKCEREGHEVSNAQEVLNTIVMKMGFGA